MCVPLIADDNKKKNGIKQLKVELKVEKIEGFYWEPSQMPIFLLPSSAT